MSFWNPIAATTDPYLSIIFGHASGLAVAVPSDQLSRIGDLYWVEALPEPNAPHPQPCHAIPLGAPATAFAVTPKHVLTSGHGTYGCVGDHAFVFNYGVANFKPAIGPLPDRYEFPASSVRFGANLLFKVPAPLPGDMALVELDSDLDVTLHPPLPLKQAPQSTPTILVEKEVSMLCHPFGAPAIASSRGNGQTPVLTSAGVLPPELRSNLVRASGCSGAPVFDYTGKVIGVHFGSSIDPYNPALSVAKATPISTTLIDYISMLNTSLQTSYRLREYYQSLVSLQLRG